MKTIRMDTQAEAKANLERPPELTHTKEELEALHACIRYTQMFKQNESYAKMDEEMAIEHVLPSMSSVQGGPSREKIEKLRKLGIGRF